MGVGETIGLFIVAGVIIGTLIFVSRLNERYMKYKEAKLTLTADRTAEKAAQYAAQVERLEARMRVLERIATDRGADLALEIEDLRTQPAPRRARIEEELN